MKMPVKALLPFGSWGYARVKYWNDRTTDFQRTKVQILGPDASMTEGVLCPDRSWKEMPLEDGLPQLGDADEERHPVREFGVPRRRIEGKTSSFEGGIPGAGLGRRPTVLAANSTWRKLGPGRSYGRRRSRCLLMFARELGDWKAAIKAEYDSLLSTGTVRKAVKNEVKELEEKCHDEGRIFKVVPGKAVCARKSPDGRRGVICGNYMQERPAEEVYASGIDVGAVRSLIRHAALERWSLVTVDVKTAFLHIPQEERKDVTIVNPPRLFQDAGVTAAGEQWIVQGTLYGTIAAPKEWGAYRDRMMAEMVWGEQGEWRLVKLPEANVWAIEKKVKVTGVVHGHVAVYVDDVMVSGTDATLAAFIEKFRSMWTCSEADWVEEGKVTKFCGLDVEKDGGGQESYIRLMMAKHEIEGISKLPKVEVPTEDEEEPELACIWHFAVKRPKAVVKIGEEVLKYLAGTPTLGLYYGAVEEISGHGEHHQLPIKRGRRTMEAHYDAAFAPGGGKSMTGLIVKYAGAPVFWASMRHLDGGYLVADGLTEQLAGTLRERLIKELLLRDGREAAVKKMCLKRLNPDVHDRIVKAAGLIVAAVALQSVADTEEAKGDDDGRSFLILIVVLVLIAGYIIGDAIKRYGLAALRRMLGTEDIVKVKLLREEALVPARARDQEMVEVEVEEEQETEVCLALLLAALVRSWCFAELPNPDQRTPLEDLKVGEEVDGRVIKKFFPNGWFVNIGATKDAFLEFEEAFDGFPPQKFSTWRKGASLSARILEIHDGKIYITVRSGSLERPPRFRRPPSAQDVEALRNAGQKDSEPACQILSDHFFLRKGKCLT
ncbi:unnamed protein product [Durusdinium trenchii]|uniref:S1 motif domain-containing protein n=1 Tax=Durusdinium trenchii TaxID=1381693 RepID=A0ABP0KAE0_9DINO